MIRLFIVAAVLLMALAACAERDPHNPFVAPNGVQPFPAR